MNTFDQMRLAVLDALARLGPTPAAKAGIDWDIVGTLVTAVATVALVLATAVLFWETRRMRESSDRTHAWDIKIFEEARKPRFILYVDINDLGLTYDIILENITDNPAFEVGVTFSVHKEIFNVIFGEDTKIQVHLDTIIGGTYETISPRQRIERYCWDLDVTTFREDVLERLSGITAHITCKTLDGGSVINCVPIDVAHARNLFRNPKNTLVAIRDQIQVSMAILTDSVERGSGRNSQRPSRAPDSVVGGTLVPPRIPRPTRDSLLRTKRRSHCS